VSNTAIDSNGDLIVGSIQGGKRSFVRLDERIPICAVGDEETIVDNSATNCNPDDLVSGPCVTETSPSVNETTPPGVFITHLITNRSTNPRLYNQNSGGGGGSQNLDNPGRFADGSGFIPTTSVSDDTLRAVPTSHFAESWIMSSEALNARGGELDEFTPGLAPQPFCTGPFVFWMKPGLNGEACGKIDISVEAEAPVVYDETPGGFRILYDESYIEDVAPVISLYSYPFHPWAVEDISPLYIILVSSSPDGNTDLDRKVHICRGVMSILIRNPPQTASSFIRRSTPASSVRKVYTKSFSCLEGEKMVMSTPSSALSDFLASSLLSNGDIKLIGTTDPTPSTVDLVSQAVGGSTGEGFSTSSMKISTYIDDGELSFRHTFPSSVVTRYAIVEFGEGFVVGLEIPTAPGTTSEISYVYEFGDPILVSTTDPPDCKAVALKLTVTIAAILENPINLLQPPPSVSVTIVSERPVCDYVSTDSCPLSPESGSPLSRTLNRLVYPIVGRASNIIWYPETLPDSSGCPTYGSLGLPITKSEFSGRISAPAKLGYSYAGTTNGQTVVKFTINVEDLPNQNTKSAIIGFWDPVVDAGSSGVMTTTRPSGYRVETFEFNAETNEYVYSRCIPVGVENIAPDTIYTSGIVPDALSNEIALKLKTWFLEAEDGVRLWNSPINASSIREWGRGIFRYARMIEMASRGVRGGTSASSTVAAGIVERSADAIWAGARQILGPGLPYQYQTSLPEGNTKIVYPLEGVLVKNIENVNNENITTDFTISTSNWNQLRYDRGHSDVGGGHSGLPPRSIFNRSVWGGFTSNQARELDLWCMVREPSVVDNPPSVAGYSRLAVTRLAAFVPKNSSTSLTPDGSFDLYSKKGGSASSPDTDEHAFSTDEGFSEYVNHHLHYGYLLYAIYISAKYGSRTTINSIKEFISTSRVNSIQTDEPFPILQVILDIASPPGTDSKGVIIPAALSADGVPRAYPPARGFDPFDGHSRGGGRGRVHQTFVSEAMLCYHSVWKLLRGNPVLDGGASEIATSIRASLSEVGVNFSEVFDAAKAACVLETLSSNNVYRISPKEISQSSSSARILSGVENAVRKRNPRLAGMFPLAVYTPFTETVIAPVITSYSPFSMERNGTALDDPYDGTSGGGIAPLYAPYNALVYDWNTVMPWVSPLHFAVITVPLFELSVISISRGKWKFEGGIDGKVITSTTDFDKQFDISSSALAIADVSASATPGENPILGVGSISHPRTTKEVVNFVLGSTNDGGFGREVNTTNHTVKITTPAIVKAWMRQSAMSLVGFIPKHCGETGGLVYEDCLSFLDYNDRGVTGGTLETLAPTSATEIFPTDIDFTNDPNSITDPFVSGSDLSFGNPYLPTSSPYDVDTFYRLVRGVSVI